MPNGEFCTMSGTARPGVSASGELGPGAARPQVLRHAQPDSTCGAKPVRSAAAMMYPPDGHRIRSKRAFALVGHVVELDAQLLRHTSSGGQVRAGERAKSIQ